MNTATAAAATPVTFTACALVRTRTENITGVYMCKEGENVATLDTSKACTRVTETGRIEFIPMGEWVLVRGTQDNYRGCWEAHTRDEARALYKSIVAGTNRYYPGAWAVAEATTKIVGSKVLPARREFYSYGDVAYMYVQANLSAMTCPIIETTYHGKTERRTAQPFRYTTPPAPGDRYSHDRVAIMWADA